MKYKIKCNIISKVLFLFCLFTSCSHDTGQVTFLQHIDSIMGIYPDSALCLLESSCIVEMNTVCDKAKYALLLTQARDKNGVIHTGDSVICIAANYYDSTKEIASQAKAHYYYGRVYQDMGNLSATVYEFLTSVLLADKSRDYELGCLVQANLGKIYYDQELYEKADSFYVRAGQLSMKCNDSARLVVSLAWRGECCIGKGEAFYPDAERLLLRALRLVEDGDVKKQIIGALSALYARMNNFSKALYYAKQRLSLLDNTTDCYRTFLLLGDAYYGLADFDSAMVYLNRSTLSNNIYTKQGAFLRLSDIARKQRNLEEALRYGDCYLAYRDSVNLARQTVTVLTSEKNFQAQLFKQEHELFMARHNYHVFFYVVGLAGLISYFLYKGRLYRLKTRALQSEQEALKRDNARLLEGKTTELKQLIAKIELLQLQKSDNSDKEHLELEELRDKIKIIKSEKDRLLKISFSKSTVYKNLQIFIKEYKDGDKYGENYGADNWKRLIAEIDEYDLNFTTRLQKAYGQLLQEDIRLCCLFLIGLSVTNIGIMMNCSRDNIYKRCGTLLRNRMHIDDPNIYLKDVLYEI